MDSSDNNELFEDEDEEAGKEIDEKLVEGDPPPQYVEGEEFKAFVQAENVPVHKKYGYVYVHTYKPFYFPGETIRGSIVLDFFNDLPKNSKKVFVRFKGQEVVGRHFDSVKDSLNRQKKRAASLKKSGSSKKVIISKRSLEVINEEEEALESHPIAQQEKKIRKQRSGVGGSEQIPHNEASQSLQ